MVFNIIFIKMRKHIFAIIIAALASGIAASAQTNLQTFYDFGRGYATTTIEGFYADNWGDTFFFFDHYYSTKDDADKKLAGACNGSYFEIERAFNFWQDSRLKDLSIHTEYDGATWGAGTFCFGLKYAFHNEDYSHTASVALMFDKNVRTESAKTPVKFSGVWGINDLFGTKGLRFNGFIDIWGNDQICAKKEAVSLDDIKETKFSILAEPQIWYNIGQLFNCPNLNIGSEIELSYNFAGRLGFMCNPCLGFKWVF